MRSIIVGCGRVGAGLASRLAREGHEVTIIDLRTEAFARLPSSFPGAAIRGDGTDEDVLRRAGAEGADWFFAVTEGDNRNILAAQLAGRTLGVSNVLAKINDPMRAEAYAALGIDTLCRTTMMVDAIARFMGYPPDPGAMDVHATEGHPLGSEHGHASDGPAGAPARASQPSRED
jgi:trk system potassium uptake protein